MTHWGKNLFLVQDFNFSAQFFFEKKFGAKIQIPKMRPFYHSMIDTQTVKQVKYLMISNRKGDLFEFSCGFCQDKFLDMKKFMLHAEKFHLKSNWIYLLTKDK